MTPPDRSQPSTFYNNKTVAITGAFGYLGTSLSDRLCVVGAALRRATRGRADTAENAEVWTGDLTDPQFCRALVAGADVVFHLAGQTSVTVSRRDPVGDLRANVESTLSLLDACAQGGRKPNFIYAGTATEIGLTTELPIPPGAVDLPITIHDANKLAAEHLVGIYSQDGAVHGVTLRIANVYGPGAAQSAPDRGIINQMIARAMAGRDLTLYGDGSVVRDCIHVDDLLDAFLQAGAVTERAQRRSYAVGSGKGHTLREVYALIAEVAAGIGYAPVKVVSMPWPDDVNLIDRRSYVADPTPLGQFCGWRPTTSLRDGIRRTIQAFARDAQSRAGQSRAAGPQ